MAELTAQQIIERIQKNIGVSWKPTDTLHAGHPDTKITGIATTFAPSLDVLRKAAASGKNLIISRESPFWNRGAAVAGYSGAGAAPKGDDMQRNATFQFKNEFIQKNNLAVFRLFDNWNARKPDAQAEGLAKALGWEKARKPGAAVPMYSVASTTLQDLAKAIRARLNNKGIRVIGNPQTRVANVALTHGFLLVPELQQVLKTPNVDCIIAGEPVEWESGPYFHDLVASGEKKGMIVIGHLASEEPGCGEMAAWLKTIVTEVPVEFIPAGDPFWVPGKV